MKSDIMVAKIWAAQEPMIKNPENRWVRNPKFNLEDAQRYGVIHYVWSPGSIESSPRSLRARALAIAEEFDEGRDWIISIGSPTLVSTLAWAIGKTGKHLRILDWDRRSHRYIPMTGN